MSFSVSGSGHKDSKKGEAEVVAQFADFLEASGANGYASFTGSHFSVTSAPAQDAVAQLREKVAAYNAEADADDQVAAPADESDPGPAVSPDSDSGEVEPDPA